MGHPTHLLVTSTATFPADTEGNIPRGESRSWRSNGKKLIVAIPLPDYPLAETADEAMEIVKKWLSGEGDKVVGWHVQYAQEAIARGEANHNDIDVVRKLAEVQLKPYTAPPKFTFENSLI